MHILLSCLQSEIVHPVPPYRYWEQYFAGGITDGGHTWEAVPGVDWAEGLLYEHDPRAAAAWRDRVWSATLAHVKQVPAARRPDLFLSYLYPWMVDEVAVAELRRIGVPCVNYFCDNVREFVRAPSQYRAFDLNWVPELAATRFYARDGVPYIHAAMPAWIPESQRRWDHAERYGVLFIGSRDALREVLLAGAIGLGAPIELYGPGWPAPGAKPAARAAAARARRTPGTLLYNQYRFIRRHGVAGYARKFLGKLRRPVDDAVLAPHSHPALDAAGYVERTQGSRVVIGVNRYPSFRHSFRRPDTYSRSRDVEAPMMGACYLTEWTPELPEMYEIGREVETYRDEAELAAKIRELDGDPGRRRQMRREGQRRALADHSVPRTIERIAERLGIGRLAARR